MTDNNFEICDKIGKAEIIFYRSGCLKNLELAFWPRPGRDITVHCLRTDRQAVGKRTQSWAMEQTKVNNCSNFE